MRLSKEGMWSKETKIEKRKIRKVASQRPRFHRGLEKQKIIFDCNKSHLYKRAERTSKCIN